MFNSLNKKIIVASLALVLLLLLTSPAFGAISVSGTCTYTGPPPDCVFNSGDYASWYSSDRSTCYDTDMISGSYPHHYYFYPQDLPAGWYYIKFFTESTGYTCWQFVYLSSGANVVNRNMCALCNDIK